LGSIYLFCLLVGGFFVAAAALSGHDADADHDLELEAGDPLDLHIDLDAGAAEGMAGSLEFDMDTDLAELSATCDLAAEHAADILVVDPDSPGGALDVGGDAVWMPVLSLRFWTYGCCFFGLTGLLLSNLGLGTPSTVLGAALGMGFGCGYIASWIFRKLRSDPGVRAMGSQHYVGALGTVLVPVGVKRPGKIRCSLRGQDMDLLAISADQGDLDRGTRVLVVSYHDDTASVVHAGRLLSPHDDS
jgi:hypothetical protein